MLERFVAAAGRDPMLIVPTADDVDRLERELTRRDGGLLGGSVTSFPRLFAAVADATGTTSPPELTRMQRIWLCRAAAARLELRQLRRSAAREGFAPALEELIADLGSAGLDASGFAAAAENLDDGAYEREIAELLSAYEALRDGLGFTDEPVEAARATAALRADPGAWRERPVLLLGFDDLSRRQIELVEALGRAAEVTVAITFGADRLALAARAELRATLAEELGAEIEPELSPPPHAETTIRHLERNLFEPRPETAAPDETLRLLEGAGERSEAELVGRRIAALLADGVDPDAIAVAVRNPDRQAPLLARVLSGLGVPVAAEARVDLAATSTGAAVLGLLAIAGGEGSADEVVAFLRGPGRARPSSVDWLERRVRRERRATAADALEIWRDGERDRGIWELDALAEAGGRRSPRPSRASRPTSPSGPTSARGSSRPAARRSSCGPPRRSPGRSRRRRRSARHAPTAAEIRELLAHVRVPLWRGPTEGRVRILSPYRLRATRVDHLFVAGLTDGAFPARGGGDPLLADERRGALGLAARRDPAAEERYLFHACVSRPERRLYLSYPVSDEAGIPRPRSPFVDEVRSLLAPPPAAERADDEVEAAIATRAEAEDVVPAPAEASTRRELARALAVAGGDPEALDVPGEARAEVAAALARRRDGTGRGRRAGPADPPRRAGRARRGPPLRRLDARGVRHLPVSLVRAP